MDFIEDGVQRTVIHFLPKSKAIVYGLSTMDRKWSALRSA